MAGWWGGCSARSQLRRGAPPSRAALPPAATLAQVTHPWRPLHQFKCHCTSSSANSLLAAPGCCRLHPAAVAADCPEPAGARAHPQPAGHLTAAVGRGAVAGLAERCACSDAMAYGMVGSVPWLAVRSGVEQRLDMLKGVDALVPWWVGNRLSQAVRGALMLAGCLGGQTCCGGALRILSTPQHSSTCVNPSLAAVTSSPCQRRACAFAAPQV